MAVVELVMVVLDDDACGTFEAASAGRDGRKMLVAATPATRTRNVTARRHIVIG